MPGPDEVRGLPSQMVANASALITGATALAYLLGYVAMSLAARGLGVSVRDLGLTLPDYVLLTATTAAYGAIAIAVIFAPLVVVPRLKGKARAVMTGRWVKFAFVAAFLSVIAVFLFFGRDGSLVTATAALFAFTASIERAAEVAKHEESRIRWVVVVVVVVGVTTATVLLTANAWGQQARSYARTGRRAPRAWLSPGQTLDPRTGIATWTGHRACVVRVGDRVLLARSGPLVVSGLDQFEPEGCRVIAHF